MSKITISKNAIKRLLLDVKEIIKHPLENNGIYYKHDNNDMLKGTAMIIGPEGTPYHNGYYLFKFKFPVNYPFQPPKVEYMTNDGTTRFNPNLYRNGKVCISILNTWKGEQWTSCQTIRTVLLTLVTLFHNKPLLNEPGIKETYKDFKAYNQIIKYKNYETAIYKVLAKKILPVKFFSFFHIIKEHILKNKTKITDDLKNMKDNELNGQEISCRIYNMRAKLDYNKLYDDITNTINSL